MLIHKFSMADDGAFPIDAAGTSGVVNIRLNGSRSGLFQATQGAAADVDITLQGSMDNTNWVDIQAYVDVNNATKAAVVTLFPYMRVVTANAAGTVTVSTYIGE